MDFQPYSDRGGYAPHPHVPPAAVVDTNVVSHRVGATLVDGILLSIVMFVVNLPLGFIGGVLSGPGPGSEEVSTLVGMLAILLYLGIFFAYFIGFEAFKGQTPGKMLLGIKVIREDTGGVPGLGAAAIRTFMRFLSATFSGYLASLIPALVSQKHQRLGDMMARTLIVRASSNPRVI